MAINSGQIDLNADAVLFDRENEVPGFNPPGSTVNVGVSRAETLTDEPIVGEVRVQDQKACRVEDDRGANGSLEPLSGSVVGGFHMNPGCDFMINSSGKEGFGKETELVDRGNELEVGVELVDGGCDRKAGKFTYGLVKNEDKKCTIGCSDGAPFLYGGAETDKGLFVELIDGVQNEVRCENARKVTENGLLSTKVGSDNESQGVDNLMECEKEEKNATLVNQQKCFVDEIASQGAGTLLNLSTVVGDDRKIKAADNSVPKDGLKDSCASDIATCKLQDGMPDMEGMDVNAKESSHHKDSFSRNHLFELETSHALKQPAFEVDAQEDVMQNRTIDINITQAGLFKNIQNKLHGFNLVVDLNSYRSTLEIGMDRKSVSSELNFCVSDLVWGKVRGHPWWPGQIFDPSAASEKAKRYIKNDCYLIAYFGDQTFAWNDVSKIKPFQMHFSQMEKQSNLENFHHAVDCALDEVSRRVEFGLSCPCMPEEVFSKLKTQVITNAGIRKQSSRRNGGDRFINVTSFEPMKLVNLVKSLAQSPLIESDRLDFVIARAQLLAFYRSKGYSQLPEFIMLGGLLNNDMEKLHMREKEQCHDQIDEQGLKTHLGFSHKQKHISGDSMRPNKKLKLLSDLMSEKSFCIPNGELVSERKAGDKSISQRSGRKRKAAYDTSDDYFHKSQNRKLIQLQYVSIDEIWSQLCWAATDPTGESHLSDVINFFAEFRIFISPDHSASLEQEMSLEQMHAGETGERSMEAEASVTSAMEPCKDSYWTDRIIERISEEQSLSKNQNEREEFLPETPTESCSLSFKSQPAAEISTNLEFMQQDTDRNLGSEPSKLAEHLGESSTEGICPTALTLKFTNLDSVPSTADLNKIFGRFGPLIESQTELLKKSSRARVVFKRRSDAETAFSSAGKYSIFGPSLVSYRLKILPSTSRKATVGAGKRGRKGTNSVEGAAV